VQLLHRTTRSVRLTEEGATYLASCRQTLAELHAAEDAIKGIPAEPQGTLVVSAPVVFGRIHVVPIVTALLHQNPRLSARLALIDRTVDLAEEGIDVAIHVGEPEDSSLQAIGVGAVRYMLVASPTYLQAHGTPAAPAELRRHELIVIAGAATGHEWRFGPGTKRTVRGRMSVNTADAAIAAAEAGFGITRALSYQVAAAIAVGRLRQILASESPPPVPVTLLAQAARSGSPNVRSFIDQAKKYFRTQTL